VGEQSKKQSDTRFLQALAKALSTASRRKVCIISPCSKDSGTLIPKRNPFLRQDMYKPGEPCKMHERFRGYLPVVVHVETGGFNAKTDALLEIAAVMLVFNDSGELEPSTAVSTHVIPFDGANIEEKSLEINGIDPWHPLRAARAERDALGYIFTPIRKAIQEFECTRAILVGHNAFFDLNFLNNAVERTGIKRNPFHPFSCFDTVSLGGLAYGQTVLSRAAQRADIPWDTSEAHSAIYDTRRTAELFCKIVNRWESLHHE